MVAMLLSVPGIDVDAHNRVSMIVIVSVLAQGQRCMRSQINLCDLVIKFIEAIYG